jgi:hypothetical protein
MENDVPPLADCYVLVDSRSKKLVGEFLSHFLPSRRSCADEFEMPQFSDNPEVVFRTEDEALSYLEEHPNETHALYWANEMSVEPRYGMVFPTNDGQIIFGLSCDDQDLLIPGQFLERMKTFLKSSKVYIAFEEPPPNSADEFMTVMKSSAPE